MISKRPKVSFVSVRKGHPLRAEKERGASLMSFCSTLPFTGLWGSSRELASATALTACYQDHLHHQEGRLKGIVRGVKSGLNRESAPLAFTVWACSRSRLSLDANWLLPLSLPGLVLKSLPVLGMPQLCWPCAPVHRLTKSCALGDWWVSFPEGTSLSLRPGRALLQVAPRLSALSLAPPNIRPIGASFRESAGGNWRQDWTIAEVRRTLSWVPNSLEP